MTHPMIKQFESTLKSGEVSSSQVDGFKKWLIGKKKPEGEEMEKAQELLADYERRKGSLGLKGSQNSQPRGQRSTYGNNRGRHNSGGGNRSSQPQRADNVGAGEPDTLGEPFHNPYTFIPFAEQPPKRGEPTVITIDEVEKERFTGVFDLEVELISPLLSNSPEPIGDQNGHKSYEALTIGNDVIVPSTGMRGVLRSLMSIVTGGTLGHLDEEVWLCQGRDAKMGPAGKTTQGQEPDQVFLGCVIVPGNINKDGKLQLGRTKLVKADLLEQVAQRSRLQLDDFRPKPGSPVTYLWTDEDVNSITEQKDVAHPWKIKLSGRPINRKGKREGLFLAEGQAVPLSKTHWGAFMGRNRHGDHPELNAGDLVWLEPTSFGVSEIHDENDIKSIQWARWGREGERLLEIIAKRHPQVMPDAFNPDGLVDEVTNLFGQVPRDDFMKEIRAIPGWRETECSGSGPAGPFAARIRPGNLFFANAKSQVVDETLAPLAPPHPGCASFYRNPQTGGDLCQAADILKNHELPLKGFKVYRTTSVRGNNAPWKYSTQGVYDENGRLKPPHQKVNKTVQLLPETAGIKGKMRISVRALNKREMALLLAACSVDWRLGGGKPLGLGHCLVRSVSFREFKDDGALSAATVMTREGRAVAKIPEPYGSEVGEHLNARLAMWQASQAEIDMLRYPRAVIENRNKKSRGGHTWFARHAQPKKTSRDGIHPEGLQILNIDDELKQQAGGGSALRAQPLPDFDAANPSADCLYGYDLIERDDPAWKYQASNKQTFHKKLEPFDPDVHTRNDQSGGFHGQNRDSRQDRRRSR